MFKIDAELMPVSAVSPDDQKLFTQWAWDSRIATNFDPDVLSYPRACVAKATNNGETSMFIPVNPVLFLESMVHKPMSKKEIAYSMWRIGEETERAMNDSGHREAYFLTNDEQESITCSKHGWTVELYDPSKKVWLMKRKIVAQNTVLGHE